MHKSVKIAEKSVYKFKKNSSIGKDFLRDTGKLSMQVALFSVEFERILNCSYSILHAEITPLAEFIFFEKLLGFILHFY